MEIGKGFIVDFLRAIGVPIYYMLLLILVAVLGDWLEYTHKVWMYYVAAVSLPIFGLLGSYILAPIYKLGYMYGVCIVGCILAYIMAFDSYYPEWHEFPYMQTHKPFFITVIVAIITSIIIRWLHIYKLTCPPQI